MTRREFFWDAAAGAAEPFQALTPLVVPVHQVLDGRAKCAPQQLRYFLSSIWAEVVRDFSRCAIQFQTSEATGEIRRSAGDRPIFIGLKRSALNLVLTDHLPMYWDHGRMLAGVTTIYEGYHLCVIALNYAHGHQIPFLSVNTCVHELLHALLQDPLVTRPKWFQVSGREFRIDSYATRLWLFHDGGAIRNAAHAYLERLRSEMGAN